MTIIQIPEYDTVLAACRGRKGLRTAKPKENGFIQYVWRMARFHSGIDTHIPVTASLDFDDWCETIVPKTPRNTWDYSKEGTEAWYKDHLEYKAKFADALKKADEYADRVCKDLGYDPNRAAKIWGRAMGVI